MIPEHYISWIYLETENGGQRKVCKVTPNAEFVLVNDKPIAVWAFCNLHGLWKKSL
jgi:superoxide reductase